MVYLNISKNIRQIIIAHKGAKKKRKLRGSLVKNYNILTKVNIVKNIIHNVIAAKTAFSVSFIFSPPILDTVNIFI